MTRSRASDFGPFGGKIWLNSAHQGPLPRRAAEETLEAVAWKVAPYELTSERFAGVPQRLREALGRLIGAPPADIILANSASYGVHLLANGIPWRAGDEVLLMKGDFPSDILPWLALERKGVRVRLITPRERVIQADELLAEVSASTRVFCVTWVHSLSGHTIDLPALGAICRARGVLFVVNASQALGIRPLNVAEAPVDAVISVGFKWLCGPYGTGFCWIRPDVRDALDYNQAYWLAMETADALGRETIEIALSPNLGARKYDVFGTANFFNFKPWAAAIEYALEQGIERIRDHDQRLVSRFLQGLDRDKYVVLSPEEGQRRSTLIFLSHRERERNPEIYEKLREYGVYVAHRAGSLRVSPHLHNNEACVDRALGLLNGF